MAVLVDIQDANSIKMQLRHAANDWWSGFRVTALSTSYLSASVGSLAPFNRYGFTGGVLGLVWLTLVSDGNYVWFSVARASTNDILAANPAYQAVFDKFAWTETATSVNSGGLCWGDPANSATWLSRLYLENTSVNNRIIGVYTSVGSLEGPSDGLFSPPMFAAPRIGNDATAQVWLPGTYHSASSSPLVIQHHPNSAGAGWSWGSDIITNLHGGGYILANIVGLDNTADWAGATASNWGAPAGLRYRNLLVDWIRRYLPGASKLGHLGFSMGGLNALAYEREYPGASAIVSICGAVDLTDSYTNRGFSTIIKNGYGQWYQSLQASTGQAPASCPSYWRPISFNRSAPNPFWYQTGYVWRNTYNTGTAYAANDVTCVPDSGDAASFTSYDPVLTPAYWPTIPIKLWHGTADTVIPIAQMTAFATAVGANVETVSVSGGGHLTTDMYDPTGVRTFFDAHLIG